MTEKPPRFPRIIRLHDGLDALDEPNRRTLTLLWWGLGMILFFCVTCHFLIRGEEAAARASMSSGFFLLATWFSTRIYWLKAAVLPRRRAGLGREYNPVRFAKNIVKLRALMGCRAVPAWNPEPRRLAAEVAAYERWLSAKDADSYRAWRSFRAQEGV